MTNGIPEAVQLASGAPITEVVFREPFPWASLCVLALWLTVVILGIVGVVRKWRGCSTASLSEKSLVVATSVLFLGSGLILRQLAVALGFVSFGSTTPKVMIQFAMLDLSHSLFFLAFNLIFAGVGFVAAILLKEKQDGAPNQPSQPIAGKSGSG